eukprot:g4968.t1
MGNRTSSSSSSSSPLVSSESGSAPIPSILLRATSSAAGYSSSSAATKEGTPTFKSGDFETPGNVFRYVRGENWDEAKQKQFISRVEKYLMDPYFLDRALENVESMKSIDDVGDLDTSEEEKSRVTSAMKTWRRNVNVGILDTASKSRTVVRILEDLASVVPSEKSFSSILKRRLAAIVALNGLVKAERATATRKYKKQVTGYPVEIATIDEICLNAMSKIIDSFEYNNEDLLAGPMQCLTSLLAEYEPLSLFKEWSPPRAPPEENAAVSVGPLGIKGSPVDKMFPASNITVASPEDTDEATVEKTYTTYWKTTKNPSSAKLDILLDDSVDLSAVEITWALAKDSLAIWAPLEWSVHCRNVDSENNEEEKEDDDDDDDDEESGEGLDKERLLGTFTASRTISRKDARTQRLSLSEAKNVRSLRVRMKGYQKFNRGGEHFFAVCRIAFRTLSDTKPSKDARAVALDMQRWLCRCAAVKALEADALKGMLLNVVDTGILSSALICVEALLDRRNVALEVLGDDTTKYARGLLRDVASRTRKAKNWRHESFDDVDGSAGGSTEAHFDASEMSESGLELAEGDMVVRCMTGNNSHALVNVGFTEGQWVWEFLLEEDRESDECTCFGAATKPVTNSTYSSGTCFYMYRCYNGQCYQRGTSLSDSKEKIHPGNVVRCELDMEAGTLSYRINDNDQGVVFNGITGEIFPAVCFYGSNRAVRLLKVERIGGTGQGVRSYQAGDPHKRRRWEGNLLNGVRHGEGKLYYTSTAGFWYGRWKNDKQHGIHAWFPSKKDSNEDGGGESDASESKPRFYLFCDDVKVREATEEDMKSEDGVVVMSDTWCKLCQIKRSVNKAGEKEDLLDGCESAADLGKRILTALAELAISSTDMFRIGDTDEADKEQAAKFMGHLDRPYALEPRAKTFISLHRLLKRLFGEYTSVMEDAGGNVDLEKPSSSTLKTLSGLMIATEQLLEANFRQLVAHSVDPLEVDIRVSTTSQNPSTLAGLLEFLEMLMRSNRAPSEVRRGAARVVNAGLSVLYPEPRARAELLATLITKQMTSNFSTESAQYVLLNCILCRFASKEGVVSLLPVKSNGKGAVSRKKCDRILDLMSQLFEVIVRETQRDLTGLSRCENVSGLTRGTNAEAADVVKKNSAPCATKCEEGDDSTVVVGGGDLESSSSSQSASSKSLLLRSAAMMLRSYQRHLLSLCSTCDSTCDIPLLLLGRYASLLLGRSIRILADVVELRAKLRKDDEDATSAGHVDREVFGILRRSIVGTLLPSFVTALNLFVKHQSVACRALPNLVSFVRELVRVVDNFEDLKESEMFDSLDRHSRYMAIDCARDSATVLSNRTREVRALFTLDPSQTRGLVVRNDGREVKTTKKGNQYAALG